MASFGILVILLICAAIAYLAREFKFAGDNRRFNEQQSAVHLAQIRKHPYIELNLKECKISREKDYVGQFDFAHKLYKEMWEKFQKDYPIGSIYEYTEYTWCSHDPPQQKTIVMESISDQKRAFQLDFVPDSLGFNNKDNNAQNWCIWESRKDAVRRGYAPDNVAETVFRGWSPRFEPNHPVLNAKNNWESDTSYNGLMTPTEYRRGRSAAGEYYGKEQSLNCPVVSIFPLWYPGEEAYERECAKMRKYLEKRQEVDNKIILNRYGRFAV